MNKRILGIPVLLAIVWLLHITQVIAINSVVVSVVLMLVLSIVGMNVILALCVSAIVAGVFSGMSLHDTVQAFNAGLGKGAEIAMSYVMLGAFAVAISYSGLTYWLADKIIHMLNDSPSAHQRQLIRTIVLTVILMMAVFSQNLIPVHIAFIPILIPPLLHVMNYLRLDRRLIACILTFGLVTPYMVLPVGYGGMFLYKNLKRGLEDNGLAVTNAELTHTMWLPAIGMVIGLLIAVFISYRRSRSYEDKPLTIEPEQPPALPDKRTITWALVAVVTAFALQLYSGSMVFGALGGLAIFFVSGLMSRHQSHHVLSGGVELMAMIGFIMISANGFAEVIRETGDIHSLVATLQEILGENKALATAIMLLVGLLITMGIGSSFSTIPLISTVYVPLAMTMGFSHAAIVALVGTAAALGDAGSPASDSTLGPTSGLNADGQHDHIRDTVIPTFIHYNLPLLVSGWIATMML